MLKTGAPIVTTVNTDVEQILTLLKNPIVYETIKSIVLQTLTDTEGCQLVQRVSNIEKHLGADEDYCIGKDIFNDDKEVLMTVPEQFSLLAERINDASIPVLKETVLVTANETEVRARLIRDYIRSVPERNGKRYMLGPELQKYMLSEKFPSEHRPTEKGVRQASIDVMKKVVEQFPNEVRMGKNSKKRNFIEYIEKPCH